MTLKTLLLVLLMIFLVFGTNEINVVEAGKPGLKASVVESTLNYITSTVLPFFQKQFQGMEFPDMSMDIGSPIGKIKFDITHMKLTSLKIPNAPIKIINGNEVQITINNVVASCHGDWHYKEHSFPKLSDHGSFDIDIASNIDLKIGVALNPKFKSGIQVLCSSFSLHFTNFKLHLHGGQSWLYNFFIDQFRGKIESEIEKQASSMVPSTIISQVQAVLDSLPMEYPIIDDIYFSYLSNEILFSSGKYISIGAAGEFIKKGITPPFSPKEIPEITSFNKMIYFFLSEFTFDSAGYVFDQAGLLKYVLTNAILPVEVLKTNYMGIFLPQLEKQFPDMDMQVTFQADPLEYPSAVISTEKGVDVKFDGDAIFQVNDTRNGSVIVDAFTIEMNVEIDMEMTLKKKNETDYMVTGKMTYEDMKVSLKQSIIGQFDVLKIQNIFVLIVKDGMIPLLNSLLENTGIPLPNVPQVQLKDPSIVYHDGYIEINSDFTIHL